MRRFGEGLCKRTVVRFGLALGALRARFAPAPAACFCGRSAAETSPDRALPEGTAESPAAPSPAKSGKIKTDKKAGNKNFNSKPSLK